MFLKIYILNVLIFMFKRIYLHFNSVNLSLVVAF